jgi:spore coat protein U-like protein
MNIRISLSVAVAIALSVAASASLAATEGTTFDATAEVLASCAVSASDMSFGQIDPLAGSATDQTSTISVTCTNGHGYDVGLDAGGAAGATVTTRQMTAGTDTLNYSLYSNAGRTTNWGDTVDTDTVAGTGTGAVQTLTVYGRVPSQPTAMVGAGYTDTINVTITY